MSIQPDNLHEVTDAPQPGTPVINYVGPATLSSPASAPFSADTTHNNDRALGWAKRVAFALLGGLMGVITAGGPLGKDWLGLLVFLAIIAGMWLGGAYAIRNRSHYAQWGVIAVVFASELTPTIALGHLNYYSNVALANGANPVGFISAAIVASAMLLAGFAVIKSLPHWRIPFGLLLISATAAGGWMSQYGLGAAFDPANYDQISNLHNWGFPLAALSPLLLACLYILPRRRHESLSAHNKQIS